MADRPHTDAHLSPVAPTRTRYTHANTTGMALTAIAAALLAAAPVHAQQGAAPASDASATAQATQTFAIAAQPLSSALDALSEQTGLSFAYTSQTIEGITSPGVSGTMSTRDALRALLTNTGLSARYTSANTVTLAPSPAFGSDNGALRFNPVRVEAVTEGTGSYTTGLTNTATRLDLSLRETPQSVSVVTRERIDDQSLEEISDVIDQTIGMSVQTGGPLGSDANSIYARGFALENYQVDGIARSTRFGFQNDIADMAVYDRVEIVRGASGLLNGVGEPSGAVNLVRKLPSDQFQAAIEGKTGSWNHYRLEGDVSGPIASDGDVRGRMVAAYHDSDNYIDRLNLRKDVLYGIVEADIGDATLVTFGVEYQDHMNTGGGRFGIPVFFNDGTPTNFSRNTNMSARQSFHERENVTLFSGLEQYFDNDWRIEIDLESSRRKYDSVMIEPWTRDGYAPDGSGTNLQARRWAAEPEQNSVNVHAVGPYSVFNREHEWVIGATYFDLEETGDFYNGTFEPLDNYLAFIADGRVEDQDVSANGGRYTTDEWQSAVYTATRIEPTDALSLIVGGRLSNWKTRTRYQLPEDFPYNIGNTSAEESSVFTPYAGAVINLTEAVSVYASYTDIFKPATVHDANGQLLDPAEGSNVEGGIKLALMEERLNLSATYYRTQKDNNPEYIPGPNGEANIGPTGQYVYAGLDGTKTTGIELEVAGQITPRWQISGGYSQANPKDKDGNDRLTYIPTDTLKLFTSYEAFGPLDGWTFGGNLRWQNSIDDDGVNGTGNIARQDSFAVVDVVAQYAITPKLTATLNVNNVFDKTYYTHLRFHGFYGAPRSGYLTVRYAF